MIYTNILEFHDILVMAGVFHDLGTIHLNCNIRYLGGWTCHTTMHNLPVQGEEHPIYRLRAESYTFFDKECIIANNFGGFPVCAPIESNIPVRFFLAGLQAYTNHVDGIITVISTDTENDLDTIRQMFQPPQQVPVTIPQEVTYIDKLPKSFEIDYGLPEPELTPAELLAKSLLTDNPLEYLEKMGYWKLKKNC